MAVAVRSPTNRQNTKLASTTRDWRSMKRSRVRTIRMGDDNSAPGGTPVNDAPGGN